MTGPPPPPPRRSRTSAAAFAGPLALVVTSREYEHLFGIYVPIAVGVFAVVFIVVIVAVIVYRRPAARAARWHEHNLAEGIYALVLLAGAIYLLTRALPAEHRVDNASQTERPALTLDVIGAKWEWHFHYPEYDIDRYSGTVGHETLVLPTGEAIRMRLTSRDVIHEFWVPALRYKHFLFPENTQVITVTFPAAGNFPGQCAELCGAFHSRMTFNVEAVSPARFREWAAAHRGRPPALGSAAEGHT